MCCRRIFGIESLREYDRGDGVCKFLDLDSNKCKIYASRPDICRVDLMYERHFKSLYSKIRFYKMNAAACNAMQEEAGIDSSFRVNID